MKCKNCGQELSLGPLGHGDPGEPRAYLSWAYGCLVPLLAVVVLVAELFLESPRSVELLAGLFCLVLVWIVIGKSIDAA